MPPPTVFAAATGHGDLLFGLVAIFVVAKVAAELFERLRQPAVVGEILAGVLIGPSVLALVGPNDVTAALSEIGVILLLFAVGLEVKPRAILKVGPMALLVAVAGVVLPFLAGWGFMSWWGTPTVENVFIGAAMVATSVGITARVLGSKGLLQAKVSQIILGAAVIDDILGLMVLSVVSSMAEGGVRVGEIATTAALSIGFTIFMLVVGAPVATRALPAARKLRVGNPKFVVALALCLTLSWLATKLNVAPIIGAFLAGMALSEAGEEETLHHEVGAVMEFLVPFFLVGIGMQLDLTVFRDPNVVLLAIVITLIAVATKFVGCGVAAYSLGARRAAQIGMGMVPRGEVGIIVAQIGLGLGVLSGAIYGVIVCMAVVTTLVAPPLLALLFAGETCDPADPDCEVVDADEPLASID
jgi:Kef-type K+ transport system membrane component KefB